METAQKAIFEMAPVEFVEALYQNCLGRTADPEGLKRAVDLIGSTGDPTLIFKNILESTEYKALNKSTVNGAQPGPQRTLGNRNQLNRSTNIGALGRKRIEMTTSCRDTDPIPKVPGAGDVVQGPEGFAYQLMHNGLRVIAGGYDGQWMTEIIRRLRGHHEPQEELLFHTVLPIIGNTSPSPTMIEFGSYWSYYSLWFRSHYPAAYNILVEPDPNNRKVGQTNFELNGVSGEFLEAAVGLHGGTIDFQSESDGLVRAVRTISIDGLIKERSLDRIHLLHADIQGEEFALLEGMKETVASGRLDWLFLSTHHHSISGDPLTHQRCLDWLRANDAFIVCEHAVSESFSGDGLIVATFGSPPIGITIPPISRNRPSKALFRETEYDLSDAWAEVKEVKDLRQKVRSMSAERDQQTAALSSFEAKLQAISEERSRFEAQLQTLVIQAKGLETEKVHSTNKIEQLENEIQAKEEFFSKQTKELEERHRRELDSVEAELRALRSQSADLARDLEKARLWVGQLSQDLAARQIS